MERSAVDVVLSYSVVFNKPEAWTEQEWDSLILSGEDGWSVGLVDMIDLIRRLGKSTRIQRTASYPVLVHFEHIILEFRQVPEAEGVHLRLVESPLGGPKLRQLIFTHAADVVHCRFLPKLATGGGRIRKPIYTCVVLSNIELPKWKWSGDRDSLVNMIHDNGAINMINGVLDSIVNTINGVTTTIGDTATDNFDLSMSNFTMVFEKQRSEKPLILDI